MHCPRRHVPLHVAARGRRCCPETLAGGKGDGGARGKDGSRSGSETQTQLVSCRLQSIPTCNLPTDRTGASAPGSQEGGHMAKLGGKGTALI